MNFTLLIKRTFFLFVLFCFNNNLSAKIGWSESDCVKKYGTYLSKSKELNKSSFVFNTMYGKAFFTFAKGKVIDIIVNSKELDIKKAVEIANFFVTSKAVWRPHPKLKGFFRSKDYIFILSEKSLIVSVIPEKSK